MSRRLTLLVLAAALAVRAAYLFLYVRSPLCGYLRNDHLYYREWALRIAAGDWLGDRPFEQGPLYAYLLGAAYRVLGPRDLPVLIAQLLAGLALSALALRCGRRLRGERAGVIAGLLAATYGPFVFYECMVMKTFLEPLLVLAALAAALEGAATGRARWFGAAGGAVGLACLVREVHVLLLAPVALAAILAGGGPVRALRGRLRGAGAALLAFALALAPAVLHNRLAARSPSAVTTGAGELFYASFGPHAVGYSTPAPFSDGKAWQEHEDYREEALLRTGRRLTPAESSRYWLDETLRHVRSAPGAALRLVGVKAAILSNDLEFPDSESFDAARTFLPPLRLLPTFGWVAGLGLLGLGVALRSRRPEALIAAGFALALVAGVVLTVNLGRYRAAAAAVWLLFAACGLDAILSREFWRRSPGLGWRLALVAAAVLLTVAAFRPLPWIDQRRRAGIRGEFESGMRDNAVALARLPALRQAVAARPGDLKVREQLGLTLRGTGRLSEAEKVYAGILGEDPGVVTARLRLAEIHAQVGDLDRAAAEALALAELAPDSARARLILGQVLFRQALGAATDAEHGRLRAEARRAFAEAATLDPRDAEARYGLAKCLYLDGDREGALRELGYARLLAPGHRRAEHLDGLIRGVAGARRLP